MVCTLCTLLTILLKHYSHCISRRDGSEKRKTKRRLSAKRSTPWHPELMPSTHGQHQHPFETLWVFNVPQVREQWCRSLRRSHASWELKWSEQEEVTARGERWNVAVWRRWNRRRGVWGIRWREEVYKRRLRTHTAGEQLRGERQSEAGSSEQNNIRLALSVHSLNIKKYLLCMNLSIEEDLLSLPTLSSHCTATVVTCVSCVSSVSPGTTTGSIPI